jgi:hypothetical protein
MLLSCVSYRSFAAQCGVVFAVLSVWLVARPALAQYSSSAQGHENVETLAQDQYPSLGGYPRQGYDQPHDDSLMSHIAVEAGAGFNRPVGYTRNFATWGGNVALGAGWKFNKWFSTLAEWQYLSDKIPGAYLAQAGVPGGHIHVWGLTMEPTVTYPTEGKLGGYVFGGGGFYRRVTTFTVPQLQEQCYYFCYQQYVNVPVAHYSSNQGGWNIGGGVTWKVLGEDSNAKVYVEGRYVRVNSPSSNVFGTADGTFSAVPISFGLRW